MAKPLLHFRFMEFMATVDAGCTASSSIDGRTLNLYFSFQFEVMIPNFYDFTVVMFVKCVVLGYRFLV